MEDAAFSGTQCLESVTKFTVSESFPRVNEVTLLCNFTHRLVFHAKLARCLG
jgi:hypothetical protein